jgi:murein DD-endopeptidase MepM/ murein hydrolase activator NlpD
MRHRQTLLATTFFAAAGAAAADPPSATVLQGGVARWSDADARECGISGRRFPAVDGVCYYPIDMKARPGRHEVALYDAAGERHLGALDVEPRECTETEITLDKAEYVDVSADDAARAAREREATLAAVKGEAATHPRFSLPLGPPAPGAGTKDRSDFCEQRLYNGRIRSRHTGLDYLIGTGTAVSAPADGSVVLAADQFYSGKTVMLDHGGGLVSMVFHLDTITVESGAQVKRGDRLGTVGESGRTTGPHLHFGARWQNQRIDAAALLGDPAKLPGIGEAEVGGDAADIEAVEADAKLPAAEDRAGEDSSASGT